MNTKETLLHEYLIKILDINNDINLTRITEPSQAELLHIEDSLAVLPELKKAPKGKYLDIGSGGGFPGVPLAIMSERDTTLIDSVHKKMNAVEKILIELSLHDSIQVVAERIEPYSQEHREEFTVITARALSSLPSLLELSSPLLQRGGHLICLKAHVSDEELSQAQSLQERLGMKLLKRRNYYLSDNETYREVLVFQKYKEPDIKLPRKVGFAQKKPLRG